MMIRYLLVVPVLIVPFGLSACSSDTSSDGGPTQASTESATSEFAGRWTVERLESAGQTVASDALQQGGDIALDVRADGTFTMSGSGAEPTEGTWTSDGTSAVLTADGSEVEAALDGDQLMLYGDDYTIVFARS